MKCEGRKNAAHGGGVVLVRVRVPMVVNKWFDKPVPLCKCCRQGEWKGKWRNLKKGEKS